VLQRLDFSARDAHVSRRSLHRLEVRGAPGRSARAGLGTAATARSSADTR
jgi:methylthioribose-1-phosphate isomerase